MKLSNLQSIDLSDNQLLSLPMGFKSLTKLNKLNLNKNKLVTFNAEFSQLINLEYLNLGNYKEEMVSIDSSNDESNESTDKQLHVEFKTIIDYTSKGNQINTFSSEIKYLKKLKYFLLGGNPIPNEEQEKIKKLLPNCKIEF